MKIFAFVLLAGSLPLLVAHPSAAASTVTTLTISPDDEGIGVSAGTVITMTATVRASGAAVPLGTVLFCDAAAAYCTDVHRIGSALLTPAGIAIYRTIPAPGTHRYQAVFIGTSANPGSASVIATVAVTHSGLYPTTTAIAETGKIGNYTLSATVGSAATSQPGGMLSFVDQSNGNALIATLPLGGPSALTFNNAGATSLRGSPYQSAPGDYNGDGLLDLAVASYNGTIAVLLGDGTGKFKQSYSIQSGGQLQSIAAADLNGDGILDLVAANALATGPTILIGQGNGKFLRALTPPAAAAVSRSVVTGDFNGDGIVDLAFANYYNNTFTVLLGNGTGLFPAGITMPAGNKPACIATGDFNGDHVPDLVIANTYGNTAAIFLGKGDGTFTVVPTLSVKGARFVAVGDFNGDGIADLAVTSATGVKTFLGVGDGTFTLKQTYTNGDEGISVAVSDFNGDGIPDLILAGHTGNLTALLGVGDGSFTAQPTLYDSAPYRTMYSAAPADFDGDGFPDLAVATHGGLSIFLTQTQTATASLSNVAFPVATGIHHVVAEYPGDAVGLPSVSQAVLLGTAQGMPVNSLLSLSGTSSYGKPVTLIASVAGTGSTPTGSVNFIDGAVPMASVAVDSSGLASYTTSALSPGSHSILSIYSGDSNYASVYSNAVPVTITIGIQAITFGAIPAQSVGNPLKLIATSSSGLPVSFVSQTPTVCSVTGAAVTLFGIGACTIQAVQAGNIDYQPAPPVARTFQVTLAGTTTIDFTSGFAQAPGLMDFNGSAGLDGSNLRLTGSTASQTGSAFYLAPVSIAEFTTYFTFQLNAATGEGITFTIQNNSPTALGDGGGSLGYGGIAKSVAIKFNPRNSFGEGSNSAGLYVRGVPPDVPAIDLTGTGIDLHSGHAMTFFTVYDKRVLYVSITDLQTHAKYTGKWGIDIAAILGSPTAYIGFTGATSAGVPPQEITSWKYLTSLPAK